jgi:hypothetical protein
MPGFVALRPQAPGVCGGGLGLRIPLALVNKLNERVAKWYAPLLSQLQGLGVTDAEWSINTLVFVRSDQIAWLQERVRTWPACMC